MCRTLKDDLHRTIETLCREGDDLLDHDDKEAALCKYQAALALLPEPKCDWDAATWILSAIGDAYFFSRRFEAALGAFSDALRCPDGLGNAFIHLRLGEAYFELGDTGRAQDELTRAYMGAGREIFDSEDPKYFSLLALVLKPPIGQDYL